MSDMSDLRAALAGRFRTVVRVPSFACPKEGTKKKIPSSAPASPAHSDAHVNGTHKKLASLSRYSNTFARRRSAPDTRHRVSSPSPQQWTEYSAGDQGLGIALWFGPTPHLPRRACIQNPFRAGADVQVAWVSGAPRQRGQLSEHRQSDASSGRVPGNLCGCADPRSGRICRGSFVLVPFIWTSK